MSYPGGKNGPGVYQWIINQQPPHERYFELFLGSGAVLRHKRPASMSYGADLDLHPYKRHTNVPVPNLRLAEMDAFAVLEQNTFYNSDLIYLDPPYLRHTRNAQRDLYTHELDYAQHERLLEIVLNLDAMVQLSGYYSDPYAERLAGWRCVTFQTMTRGGKPATECLWMNYPAPVALHDTRYLGADYRERERIKRKRQRWIKRLETMEEAERYAMLSAIGEVFGLSPGRTAISDVDSSHRQE